MLQSVQNFHWATKDMLLDYQEKRTVFLLLTNHWCLAGHALVVV
jgi:hypothetical protein